MDLAAINEKVIHDFRAGGEIGVRGMHRERMLLLTTIGRASGRPRTAPMMFVRDGDGILVVASANAAPRDPHWVLNVVADPRVHVELPDAEWDGSAAVLDGARREAAWVRVLERAPFFADHQAKVARRLPVVELTPDAG
ncbi:MAG: nitroreductase family deazaflavin-dependent oxidoreductase [Micrococcales bacterium]|nr:nitroreductase family deazaflavin-dependent oxidoreductase [Micrococcales bacterium]